MSGWNINVAVGAARIYTVSPATGAAQDGETKFSGRVVQSADVTAEVADIKIDGWMDYPDMFHLAAGRPVTLHVIATPGAGTAAKCAAALLDGDALVVALTPDYPVPEPVTSAYGGVRLAPALVAQPV